MKVLSLQDAEKVKSGLNGRIMFSGERTEVVHLQLQQGEVLAPHSNEIDVIFYCLEGEAMLIAGDETFMTRNDCCVMVPAHIERSWVNTGEGILRVLVIKQKHH